jgi:SagB-type dehydrogenase family enzyme
VTQTTNVVDARWIAQSFSRDPDMSLPERPRLIPELVAVPCGADGILFAGAETTELIRGKSTRTLLPRVLPLLDGTRTLPELAQSLHDVPPQHVIGVISLLYSRGLLEDGRPGEQAFPHVAAFAGRYSDASRVNRNRGEAMARLAAARVRVSGSPAIASMVMRDLRDSGVGDVELADAGIANDEPADLTVFIANGDDPVDPDAIDRVVRDGGRAFFLGLGTREAQIGPLFLEGVTSCCRCLFRAFPRPAGPTDPLFARMAAGLAALQIFHALSRIASGALHTTFRILSADEHGVWTQEQRLAARTPGCRTCGLGGSEIGAEDPRAIAWIYHVSTSFQTDALIGPKDHQAHHAVASIKLAAEAKARLFTGPTVALPEPLPLHGTAPWLADAASVPASRADLGHVATLLARAAGEVPVDGGGSRRVAPTGGNLGSVDLWLLAHDVDGLERAVYHYDAPRHQLERVTDLGGDDLARAFGDAALETQCLIVGSGALAKLAQKYKSFAYRLVHYDAGVALAYLHELARSFGLPLREVGDFHDGSLAGLLGLTRRSEFPLPTFVAALGAGSRAFAPPRAAGVAAPLAPSDRSMDAVHRLMDDSAEIAPPEPARPSAAAPSSGRVSPRPAVPSFDEILLSRRSIRDWAPTPVDADLVLELMLRADAMLRHRRAAGAGDCFVRPVAVLARGTDSFAAGLYELDGDRLRFRAPVDARQYAACVNQLSFSRSPASIVMIADLDATLARRGARGYREAALDAGAAIGTVWLAATAHGLAGSAAGGAVTSGFRAICGMDGYVECPLLGFHFGWPAGASAPD